MSEIEKLFHDSDNPSDTEARLIVIHFLKDTALALSKAGKDPIAGAYDITGLTGSNFFQALPPGDPLEEIFTIAGELEINPQNADELTQELIDKIAAL